MKNIPQYTISDIQLAVGDHEFRKALGLYEKYAVSCIEKDFYGYCGVVSGTHDYTVRVSVTSFEKGDCDCYLGQKGDLCKHILALAIALVYKYRPDDTESINNPLDRGVCSGQIREITKDEVAGIKSEISKGMAMIKAYNGSSSKWFQYQDDLTKGSRLILLGMSKLPVCEKSATICIETLKKLDKKLLNSGVDDSNGTVGDLMVQIVEVLNLFADSDKNLKVFIREKLPKGHVFDWESVFRFMNQ